jgi:hypothetical protein
MSEEEEKPTDAGADEGDDDAPAEEHENTAHFEPVVSAFLRCAFCNPFEP